MSAERRSALIVSPHLDDAALSASDRLRSGTAVVVTVCAGVPGSSVPPGWWDRLTGATSARQRQEERIAEDAAAMRFARAAAVRLEHLDGQYRDGQSLDVDAVAADLAPLVAAAAEVWLPAGIGHDDHVATRVAGMATAKRRGHASVLLYADVPHATVYGWPTWVTGEEAPAYLDAEAWLADQLQASGLDVARLSPHTVRLDKEGLEFKRALVAHYPTQLPVLGLGDGEHGTQRSALGYEVVWECPL